MIGGWVLMFWIGVGLAPTMEQVHGFSTEAACEAAGVKASGSYGAGSGYSCIEVK